MGQLAIVSNKSSSFFPECLLYFRSQNEEREKKDNSRIKCVEKKGKEGKIKIM